MYWIEVDFQNGKTLRKDSELLNDTYEVYCRYTERTRRNLVVTEIRAGHGNNTTMVLTK